MPYADQITNFTSTRAQRILRYPLIQEPWSVGYFWLNSHIYSGTYTIFDETLFGWTPLYLMVLIWDGSSENVAHVWSKVGIFRKKSDLTHLFRCNKMPSTGRNTWMTAPCSELPSNIRTTCLYLMITLRSRSRNVFGFALESGSRTDSIMVLYHPDPGPKLCNNQK